MKKQVVVYLQRNELTTIAQSAFLEYHNTNTALHKVIDDWLYNMADGLFTAICSFDSKKCFNTIDHEIIRKWNTMAFKHTLSNGLNHIY